MAQLREIRKRIKSITNTSKVTHAMELIAATKMRKSQQAAIAGRPYSVNLNLIIDQIRQQTDEASHNLLKPKQSRKELTIIVSSDRGLAGGLNINLFREILAKGANEAVYIAVGKKATQFAVKTGREILASFESEEKSPLDLSRTLSKMATDAFIKSEVNKVSILYPRFENTTNQVPVWTQILPVEFEEETQLEKKQLTNETASLLFEPNARKILDDILPHYVLTQIYQILLESKASEHSARMVAMKNATDAANDLVDDLTLTYNQARQETITKELLDIVTAQRAFE